MAFEFRESGCGPRLVVGLIVSIVFAVVLIASFVGWPAVMNTTGQYFPALVALTVGIAIGWYLRIMLHEL